MTTSSSRPEDSVEYDAATGKPIVDRFGKLEDMGPTSSSNCKHRNIWLICGGGMCWCYQCGAVRPNAAGNPKAKIYWQPPSKDGENPAMKKWYPALTWKEQSNV